MSVAPPSRLPIGQGDKCMNGVIPSPARALRAHSVNVTASKPFADSSSYGIIMEHNWREKAVLQVLKIDCRCSAFGACGPESQGLCGLSTST